LVSQEQKRPSAAPSLMAGVALIVLGVAFILVQSVDFSFLETWWPLFVLVPGLLFFVMMLASGEKGGALAIPGSILTSIGGILLYQNFSGDWASWSYAWALVAPGSVGFGLYLFGLWGHVPSLRPVGLGLMLAGLVLFAGAAAFFEFVLGVGGAGEVVGRVLWPSFLILAGTVLMLSPWLRRREKARSEQASKV
jgi:hypothetical protein